MRAGNTPGSPLAGMPLSVPGALAGQLLGVVSERRQPDCTAQETQSLLVQLQSLYMQLLNSSFLHNTTLGAAVLLEVGVPRPGRALHEFHCVPLLMETPNTSADAALLTPRWQPPSLLQYFRPGDGCISAFS